MKITNKKELKLSDKKPSRLKTRGGVIGLSVLLGITISAGSYYLMIKPQLDRVGPGRELDIETISANLEQQKKSLSELKLLQDNFNEINPDDVILLSNVLPNDKAVPELLSQLETIALTSGVDLTRVSISEIQAETLSARDRLQQEVSAAGTNQTTKGLKELLLQIEVDAFNYNSFKIFLNSLESHTRLIDVQSFNFQSENDQQRITAKTYYLPE